MSEAEAGISSVPEMEKTVIGRWAMTSALWQLHGMRLTALLCAAEAILLAAGFAADLRWAVVGLMIAFLVAPGVLAFLYFYHALTPVTSANVVPHTLESDGSGGFRLRLWRKKEAAGQTAIWEQVRTIELPAATWAASKTLLSHTAMIFKHPNKGVILIPFTQPSTYETSERQ